MGGGWDLIFFFLIPEVEIEKQGLWQEADSIRKFVKGNVTPSPARAEASSTRRAGGVDPLEALTRKAPRLVSYRTIAVRT